MLKMTFLKLRTDAALKKKPKTIHASMPYREAVNIGIIFTVEDKEKHGSVKDFIHKLERDGKKVQVLEFLPEKKNNHEFKFDFFTIHDLSFWGNVTAANALKFTETPFDFLFYPDKESNPIILHLLARCKAHCRVGKFNEAESVFFELMIEHDGSNEGLMETMYNYTCQLR